MNTTKLSPINDNHTFGDSYNNYVLTLGQDTPDKAPNTKDYTNANAYYYDLVEYAKQYVESRNYGTVQNNFDVKGQFYHFSIVLNDETACKGGLMVNEYTGNLTNNSLFFKAESCNASGCVPFVDANNNVMVATNGMTALSGASEIDFSQRSKVITIRDSAIFGMNPQGEMVFLDNIPEGTVLGYANGRELGTLKIRTFEGVDVFINSDSVQYQS